MTLWTFNFILVLMISRKNRFHGYNSLRVVYSKGKTVRGANAILKFLLNERRKTYRLSVVVSKKINKSAVARNRIRRRLYEAVRLQAGEINQPYDMVLTVVSEKVADSSPEDLKKLINHLLTQANIVKWNPHLSPALGKRKSADWNVFNIRRRSTAAFDTAMGQEYQQSFWALLKSQLMWWEFHVTIELIIGVTWCSRPWLFNQFLTC